MILCVTPNPAIDRTLTVPQLTFGKVHRSEQLIVAAGGKGLNVARTIRRLGGQPFCMGFAGGHSGRLLADLARQEGLEAAWTWTDSETRTCTILISDRGDATLVNEPGMPVIDADWIQFQQDLREHISSASLVCISGSFPPGARVGQIREFLAALVDTGKQVWVDTSGVALETAAAVPGIRIKVNGEEIGAILGIEVKDPESAKQVPAILFERGLHVCVITLGVMGALLATKEGRWHARGPQVNVVSTVGSGDAFFGGLVCALDRGKDWPDALSDAVAAGTANVLSAGGGQFSLEDFRRMRDQTEIQAW